VFEAASGSAAESIGGYASADTAADGYGDAPACSQETSPGARGGPVSIAMCNATVAGAGGDASEAAAPLARHVSQRLTPQDDGCSKSAGSERDRELMAGTQRQTAGDLLSPRHLHAPPLQGDRWQVGAPEVPDRPQPPHQIQQQRHQQPQQQSPEGERQPAPGAAKAAVERLLRHAQSLTVGGPAAAPSADDGTWAPLNAVAMSLDFVVGCARLGLSARGAHAGGGLPIVKPQLKRLLARNRTVRPPRLQGRPGAAPRRRRQPVSLPRAASVAPFCSPRWQPVMFCCVR